MTGTIRTFGVPAPGADYLLRPGGYVVAFDAAGAFAPGPAIAVVSTPAGLYLPGGGQEAGESPEAAAVRETREECGLEVRLLGRLCAADELVHAASETRYYRKRCVFFRAVVVGRAGSGGDEPDHALVWLPPAEAAERLGPEIHRWAMALALGDPGALSP